MDCGRITIIRLGNFLGKRTIKLSLPWIKLFHVCGEQHMDQVYDIKVKRHTLRAQFKMNRNFIVESSEEEGQPGTVNKLRMYSFVFVKIYPYIPLPCLSHTFLLWLGFKTIWRLRALLLSYWLSREAVMDSTGQKQGAWGYGKIVLKGWLLSATTEVHPI